MDQTSDCYRAMQDKQWHGKVPYFRFEYEPDGRLRIPYSLFRRGLRLGRSISLGASNDSSTSLRLLLYTVCLPLECVPFHLDHLDHLDQLDQLDV